jgi:predicted NodU family carbamoyl transferase
VNIISLNFGHNATVGLTIDGLLVSLVHEERITRKKNYTGFPVVALKFVIAKYLNNNLNNIDKIIFIDKTGNGLNFLFTQSFKNTLEIIAGHFDYAYKIKNNILRLYYFYIFFKKIRLTFILNILVKFKNNIKQYIKNIFRY